MSKVRSDPFPVHIFDVSGDEVDAGPAFLNVIPRGIAIPAVGTIGIASVYPAQITVDKPDTISSVEVVLNGFTHQRPDDVDILLVSPRGKKIMLMSDAGGITTGVQNLTLTFSSQSASLPPDETQLFTGTYAASNYGEPETSLPQATGGNPNPPAGPYTDTLFDLIGTDPRGVWQLYIVDDTGQRSGSISGSWCLIVN